MSEDSGASAVIYEVYCTNSRNNPTHPSSREVTGQLSRRPSINKEKGTFYTSELCRPLDMSAHQIVNLQLVALSARIIPVSR